MPSLINIGTPYTKIKCSAANIHIKIENVANKNPKDKILYPNNSLKNLIYVHIIRFSPIAKVIIIPEVNTITVIL